MATKACKKCKSQVPERAKFCNICGNDTFEEATKCPFCSFTLPNPNIKFCPSCGKRISSKPTLARVIRAPDGELHRCGICKLKIQNDLTVCPSCLNPYHFPHLANWIVEKKECPMCRTELRFA
ncbi:MAG: zinc ribbon domain-containing protein [Candidatus Heimdallarchaeota archaeon]|nr:zinc ribbon domain-containing protein [Candidatus Heimdallarchaeota archaeon]